jgi:hypothetical protein
MLVLSVRKVFGRLLKFMFQHLSYTIVYKHNDFLLHYADKVHLLNKKKKF